MPNNSKREIIDELRREIEEMQAQTVDYVRKLVSFPSWQGQEEEAQGYVKEVLGEIRCDAIDVWEPDAEELRKHEINTNRKDFQNSPNVVGVWKGTGGGRSLIINSHIDVVPAGNEGDWQFPPFGGRVEDGKVYGRGSSDMKGAHAAVFVVVKALNRLGIELKGDLVFESVIDEETGGAGTLACSLRGYKADAAIIPEPSKLAICPAQQGSTWFRIKVRGRSAHGGQRYLGISAIDKAMLIVSALKELEEYRNSLFANNLYENVPIPFCISVGTIEGGDWPATVPECVIIQGRMGVAPGEEVKEGRRMLEQHIEKLSNDDHWMKDHKPEIEWFGTFGHSAEIKETHPIVCVSKKAYSNVMNEEPRVSGTEWSTDASFITKHAETPTIVFGPGECAHVVDEYISIEMLMNYEKILAEIVLNWCDYSLIVNDSEV